MGLKAVMLLNILFTLVLLISSEAAAESVTGKSENTSEETHTTGGGEVNESKQFFQPCSPPSTCCQRDQFGRCVSCCVPQLPIRCTPPSYCCQGNPRTRECQRCCAA